MNTDGINAVEDSADSGLIRKWRLILGPSTDPRSKDASSSPNEDQQEVDEIELDEKSRKVDKALSLLFDETENGVLKRSRIRLNEWLGDIRDLFPHHQTLFLQKEAIDKLGIGDLLFEKEVFDALTVDIQLIRTIIELKDQIPPERMQDVRELVQRYARDIEDQIGWNLQNVINHQHEKGEPTHFPRKNEIDWPKTIRQNLRHYQPDLQTLMIKQKYGYVRKKQGIPAIYLAVDSSGSMMESMISSAVLASILAHIRSIETRLILFDHEVADLSDHLKNIVDLLFHIQLGGGTNILKALNYLHDQIRKPEETYLFLISDLYDNRTDQGVLDKITALQEEGVKVHCILAMEDNPGRTNYRYNKNLAAALTNAGIPCYTSSADQFAEILKKAMSHQAPVHSIS